MPTFHIPRPIRLDVMEQEPAPKLRHVMATTCHVMATMPESRYVMTTAAESLHVLVPGPVVPVISRPVVPSPVFSVPPSLVVPDMVPVWRHWSRRKYLIEIDAVYWMIDRVID